MLTEKNLLDMIEVITTAIEIHAREEDFFRSSSQATSDEAAKALLLEIAQDLCDYREKLEGRRNKLRGQLDDLEAEKKKQQAARSK